MSAPRSNSLVGRVAVVTGAGRGIGLAYGGRLCRDGATVVGVDLDDPSGRLVKLPGTGVKVGLACDVGDPHQISRVAAAVEERFGRCDILVSNAATFPRWCCCRATQRRDLTPAERACECRYALGGVAVVGAVVGARWAFSGCGEFDGKCRSGRSVAGQRIASSGP